MARKRKGNRRRRRGRFSALWRILCTALVTGAIVAAMTLFFKVQDVVVSGNERYREEEVVQASGIEKEDNLFLLNKYKAAQTIFEQLPYVEEASINRKLPDTIVITVRECTAAAGIKTEEGVWLISESGKLLEAVQETAESVPRVIGLALHEPTVSAQLDAGEDGGAAAAALLLNLLSSAREQGMLADIAAIDLTDATAVRLEYLGRFTVKLPWDAEIDYALRMLKSVAEKLETNETGEISLMNLMEEGKVNFIPGARKEEKSFEEIAPAY